MVLTILEILYIVLIVFSTIIWTLLIIVLMRVIKILWPIVEMAWFYNKFKWLMASYAAIPEIIKEKLLNLIKRWKKNNNEEENDSEDKD